MIWVSTDVLVEVNDDSFYVELNGDSVYVDLGPDTVRVEINERPAVVMFRNAGLHNKRT